MQFNEKDSINPETLTKFQTDSIVVSTFLIMLFSFGVQSAFGVFFDPMLKDFGWTRASISGAFSISWIVVGLMGIVMGFLCDKYGSRWILTICGILLGAGYMLMSYINSEWQFYLYYGIIFGVGMSGIWVPTMSMIAKTFTDKRNLVTAIDMGGAGIGTLVGPLLANWLIANYSWRIAYFLLGISVLIVVTLGAQFSVSLRKVKYLKAEPLTEVSSKETNVGGLTFKQALVTRQFWLFFWVMFCVGFCVYAINIHVAPHAIGLGASSSYAAFILAALGGTTVVSRLITGYISKRISSKPLLIIGFSIIALASIWLINITEPCMLFLAVSMVGLGFGTGVLNSPFVAELFGLKSHGIILGLIILGYSAGCALGPFTAGALFDITNSYKLAFEINTVLAIIGAILMLLIKPNLIDRLSL